MDTSESAATGVTGAESVSFSGGSESSSGGIESIDAQANIDGFAIDNSPGDIGPTGEYYCSESANNTTEFGYSYDPMETVSKESIQIIAQESFELTSNFAVEHGSEQEIAPLRATDISLRSLPDRVLGAHSMDTHDVFISDELINDAARHTTNHEFMHRASYQSYTSLETDQHTILTKTSGIHTLVEETDLDTGEVTKSDYYRELNEGLTEKYTLQAEREAYGEEIDCGIRAYSENMVYAAALSDAVGEQAIDEAYFNGDLHTLCQKVNDLVGNNEGFSSFAANVDIICSPIDYTMSPEDVQKAVAQKADARENLNQLLLEMAKAQCETEKEGKLS